MQLHPLQSCYSFSWFLQCSRQKEILKPLFYLAQLISPPCTSSASLAGMLGDGGPKLSSAPKSSANKIAHLWSHRTCSVPRQAGRRWHWVYITQLCQCCPSVVLGYLHPPGIFITGINPVWNRCWDLWLSARLALWLFSPIFISYAAVNSSPFSFFSLKCCGWVSQMCSLSIRDF